MSSASNRPSRQMGWRWAGIGAAAAAVVTVVIVLTQSEPPAPLAPPPPTAAAPMTSTAGLHRDGKTAVIIDNGDTLHAYIAYPETGLPKVDAELAQWAQSVYDAALTEAAQDPHPTAAMSIPEVNTAFESYAAPDGLLSIEERVFYSSATMAHPSDEVTSFIVDTNSELFLQPGQIIDSIKADVVTDSLRQHLTKQFPELSQETLDGVNATWLDKLTPTASGLGVALPRGDFLQSSYGTVRVELPYSEIGPALLRPVGLPTQTLADTPQKGSEPTPPEVDDPATTDPNQEPLEPELTPSETESDQGIDPPPAVSSDKPMIALTFDDGPSDNAIAILKALKQYGGRATFFAVGNRVEDYAKVAKSITAYGSELAGHSWDHRQLTDLSESDIRDELTQTAQVIKATSGSTAPFYRPPYGAVDDTVTRISAEVGLALINWSIDTEDWRTKNTAETVRRIMTEATDGAIVLCHDIHIPTVQAAVEVIAKLSDQGYQLVTISELMAAKGIAIKPGHVYNQGN